MKEIETIPKSMQHASKEPLDKELLDALNYGMHLDPAHPPLCPVCGNCLEHEHNAGHIISRKNGGSNDWENIVAVHKHCNVGTTNIDYLVSRFKEEELLMARHRKQKQPTNPNYSFR